MLKERRWKSIVKTRQLIFYNAKTRKPPQCGGFQKKLNKYTSLVSVRTVNRRLNQLVQKLAVVVL